MSTIFLYIYTYLYFSIYIPIISHDTSVDRPSHSQCVLNWLPHAAHTTIPLITFCNVFMRFNQSNKFNIFISNVFYMVVYNCITLEYTIDTYNCIKQ